MLTVSLDLHAAAHLLAERGLWKHADSFGSPIENGPIDPVLALWLVAHPGKAPRAFTNPRPGYADTATGLALADKRVARAVRHLSASLTDTDTATREDDPVERIADWVRGASVDEVIGRLIRLSRSTLAGTVPAAA